MLVGIGRSRAMHGPVELSAGGGSQRRHEALATLEGSVDTEHRRKQPNFGRLLHAEPCPLRSGRARKVRGTAQAERDIIALFAHAWAKSNCSEHVISERIPAPRSQSYAKSDITARMSVKASSISIWDPSGCLASRSEVGCR